jgi:NAD(P)-dependent dehydrogenase (short-subunit alcohol dehydrogenase family)
MSDLGNPSPDSDVDLQGQVAVVTGAGRGVGRAIAESLAAAGALVALAARSRGELDEAVGEIVLAGGRALAIPTDVTDESEVASLFGQVESELGSPTLLVNNAGTWHHAGPLEEADLGSWWSDVEVCLKGTFLCTRAVLPGMRKVGRGRIVNVSSYAGIAPRPYATAYAAAKAAVLRLTDSLAAELEGTGVVAFAITPGFVRTAMVDRIASSEQGRRFLPELGERSDAIAPAEAGRLVVDIAAGRLDGLTGRFFHVLDDVDDLLAHRDEILERDLYSLGLRRLT